MEDNTQDNDIEWRRFCRLGDMIGDGLHYEDKSISREYKRLAKILMPKSDLQKEHDREQIKRRNEKRDLQITEKLKTDKCKCGGDLKQTRKGSLKVICSCGLKYTYKSRRIKT